MKKITDEITLRPLREDETEFWREIFYDSVRSHFLSLNLPESETDNLIEFQYQAQSLDYEKNYPLVSNNIVLFNAERVGRLIYSTEHGDLHIIEMAILTEFRGRGIGTKLFRWFFDESRRSGLPIRFYVEKGNPAFRLYRRLGFEVVADVNTHFQLAWKQ